MTTMTEYATLPEMQLWAARIMHGREPDQIIGEPDNVYLKRWFVTPRSPWGNTYLHAILRSDDDRALHDHPFDNRSLVLDGGYWEHLTTLPVEPGFTLKNAAYELPSVRTPSRVWRGPGSSVMRAADAPHRLELEVRDGRPVPCVSLFFTGPKIREWGFHCEGGWRHWEEFDVKGCE